MFTLGIVSRDAEAYADLIKQAALSDMRLQFVSNATPSVNELAEVQILLADPNLIAPSLSHCQNLTWLQSTWAGNRPILAQAKQDFVLTGVKSVFGQAMSEYALTYMLHFQRQVPYYQTQQRQQHWQPLTPEPLAGKTLGILGVGDIGKSVAKTAKSLGMRVLGLSRQQRDCADIDEYFGPEHLLRFAAALDYCLSLLPDTPATRGLINRDFLQALPTHAVLINAGRGSVIIEQDLIVALQESEIKAAVLDVFEQEPLPPQHPFWTTPNLLITQHTAAVSCPKDIVRIFTENYRRFSAGESLLYQLDFERGY